MACRLNAWATLSAFIIASSAVPGLATNDAPRTLLLDGALLSHARRQSQAQNSELGDALKRLINDADRAAHNKLPTVTAKSLLPPSGDRHDYMSLAPYWWPNPNSLDGLPYVRRDGEVNPERRQRSDRQTLARMTREVSSLALAYYFTRDEKYAEHAARRLRAWFLDPATRMNAHLNYAQAVPGRNDGRAAGIIETHELPTVIDAIELIAMSKQFGDHHRSELRRWFARYLSWLIDSPFGKQEAAAKNNHGSWYDVQVAAYALFTQRTDIAKTTLRAFAAKRMQEQIDSHGRQRHELQRTRAWSYALFNLEAHVQAATLAQSVGIDLWSFESGDRPSLVKALDWLVPFATGTKIWPYREMGSFEPQRLAPLLRRASHRLGDQRYEDTLRKIPGISGTERWQLIDPIPITPTAQ